MSWAVLIVMALLLVVAVATDLRSRRIPNRLIALGLGCAVLLHGWAVAAGLPPQAGAAWWAPLAGLAAGGALLMPLYLVRACGAGDVKLMAMVGAFTGAATVLHAALYTLLLGGVLSLGVMLVQGVSAQVLANLRFLLTDWMLKLRSGQRAQLQPLAVTAARLPYAVAIASGSLVALCVPPPW
jgi:prepilin peptidase CpaA